MNDLKDWLKAKSNPTSDEVVRQLAKAGEDFNSEKNKEYEAIAKKNVNSIFSLAIAISLEWGGFAKKDEQFYQLAANYLANDDIEALAEANKFSVRKDSSVKNLLTAWKRLLKQSGASTVKGKFALKELLDYQKVMLDTYNQLKVSKKLQHIGMWFLLAPFKIVLLMRKDLWNEQDLDKLLLPVGSQVEKGLNLLEKKGVPEVTGLKSSLDEKDVEVSIANVERTHRGQELLAKTLQPKVLHINTGLHLVGQK